MSPPLYASLDKKCKDIFTKGYSFGLIKIDCKTKTSSGINLGAGFTNYNDTGKMFGNLDTEYKIEDRGITLSEKWNTDNVLVTEIIFEKPLVYELLQGVKTSLEATFAPSTGQKSGRIKLEYKQDLFAGNFITDVLTTGCQCHLSGAVGQSGWLAGGQISYDTSSGQITKNSVGLGYDVGDLAIVGNVNDGQEFVGSVYHRVNSELEAGVQLSCSGSEGSTARFGMGAKYLINNEMTVGGKVNNLCQLGLSFQRKVNNNVTATVSALVEGTNLSQHGGHKLGLSVDVEI